MSRALALRYVADPTVLVFIAFFALIRLFSPDNVLLIYALSYSCHVVNLQAFIGRRYAAGAFAAHSVMLRTVALATLGVLMIPYLGRGLEPLALIPFGAGVALQLASLRALGFERTYYGAELGQISPEWIVRFPYGYLSHPMAIGACLQFAGLYLLTPAFNADYPFLVPGHVALTVVTAVVEHFGWHFSPSPARRRTAGEGARETRSRA